MDNSNLLKKYWNGEIMLWKSYWIVGFLVTILVVGLLTVSVKIIHPIFVLILLTCYTVFLMVGLWRSATKYNTFHTGMRRIWGWLVKAGIIYSVVITILGIITKNIK